jgi:methionyl-tRNA formyltransferase
MRIVWIGFHEVGLYAFEHFVLNKKYEILSFITLNDDEYSKRSAGSRRYIDICDKHLIPVHYIKHINDEYSIDLISKYDPDIIVLMGWSQIANKRVLSIPNIGVIGGHSSLLPHNKGNSPINWSIINDEKTGGMTLMFLDETVDGGRIISQLPYCIEFYDTCKTLYNKVSELIYIQLLDVFSKISANLLVPIEQKVINQKLLPRRKPKDGLIDWNKSSLEIYNLIRAITYPYPCAFSYYNNKKIKIIKSSYLDLSTDKIPGEVLGYIRSTEAYNCGIVVGCGSGLLILNEIEFDDVTISGYEIVNYLEIGNKFENRKKDI